MPISVQPLTLTYSFQANRTQATDMVDLQQLDAAFAQITGKLNEILVALDETMRDDNTLDDAVVEPRHLHEECYKEITAIVNGTSSQPGAG
jgi:hypothetical protein